MSEETEKKPEGHVLFRIMRRLLFVAACLVTLVALLFAEENWRGRHAWETYKNEWGAKGEKFDFASYVPPRVPDDQNFAMTPLLAPLFDFNPEPLQPGQDRWRDKDGHVRVAQFAAGLFTLYPNSKLPVHRRWTNTITNDAAIWMQALQTNSADSQFTSTTEAAKELLKDFAEYRPELDELETASHRPYARFNLDYTREPAFEILLPHLAVLKRFAMVLQLRARAESLLGQTEAAHKDIGLMLVLARSVKDEPILISSLVEFSVMQMAIREIQQGLTTQQWTDAELADLETKLGKMDLLAEYGHTMRGERALSESGMDYFARNRRQLSMLNGIVNDGTSEDAPDFSVLVPTGWFRQNQVVIARVNQELYLAPVDAAHHRVDVAAASQATAKLEEELAHGFPPYHIFARLLLPGLSGALTKFSAEQVQVDETIIACALERYRLANGNYPETLAALAPKYVASVPNDVISGEPLKYHRTDEGKFILYSVGRNGKDEGGKAVFKKDKKTPVLEEGDWVWPMYPYAPGAGGW